MSNSLGPLVSIPVVIFSILIPLLPWVVLQSEFSILEYLNLVRLRLVILLVFSVLAGAIDLAGFDFFIFRGENFPVYFLVGAGAYFLWLPALQDES